MEELAKVGQKEHKFYEDIEKDVIEASQFIPKIKQEIETVNGFKADVINEERIRKLEST